MEFTYQSLDPVPVTKPTARNMRENRTFQGIPGIAVLPSGRIFAVWYSGGDTEGPENYVMMVISDDHGKTWSDAVAVVDPPSPQVRTFDSAFWISPDGRFHWFWAQSSGWFDGIAGVWHSVLENPEADPSEFRFTPSVRIANGIMMNKPSVLSDGAWALPVSIWTGEKYRKHDSLGVEQGCYMVVSEDGGNSFHIRGRIGMSGVEGGPSFDEHCFVEHSDGSIECWIRVNKGVATSISRDRGATWSAPELSKIIDGPNSRMYAVRLRSGRILMVNNDMSQVSEEKDWRPRERMTAYLSEDDGRTWPHTLLLDERSSVSYPDAQEGADGFLYIIYDHERTGNGDILMARITEADILAGKTVSPESRLKLLIDHTKGVQEK